MTISKNKSRFQVSLDNGYCNIIDYLVKVTGKTRSEVVAFAFGEAIHSFPDLDSFKQALLENNEKY